MKVLFEDGEKIVVRIPPVVVDNERIELLIIKPHGMEFITKKGYIRMIGKHKAELANRKRVKHQDFKDFLIMNMALERIFGIPEFKKGCDCNDE